jgi:hypothetical protein
MGTVMRSTDWAQTPIGPRRVRVARASDDGLELERRVAERTARLRDSNAIISLQNADFGNIQRYNPELHALEIVCSAGSGRTFWIISQPCAMMELPAVGP